MNKQVKNPAKYPAKNQVIIMRFTFFCAIFAVLSLLALPFAGLPEKIGAKISSLQAQKSEARRSATLAAMNMELAIAQMEPAAGESRRAEPAPFQDDLMNAPLFRHYHPAFEDAPGLEDTGRESE